MVLILSHQEQWKWDSKKKIAVTWDLETKQLSHGTWNKKQK